MFLGLRDPHTDPSVTSTEWIRLEIRLRILPSSSKNSKKNLDFYCFVTFYDFLSLKNYVNLSVFRIHIRIFYQCFWASRIRIWIRKSEVRIRRSGSAYVPQCHGSLTLAKGQIQEQIQIKVSWPNAILRVLNHNSPRSTLIQIINFKQISQREKHHIK